MQWLLIFSVSAPREIMNSIPHPWRIFSGKMGKLSANLEYPVDWVRWVKLRFGFAIVAAADYGWQVETPEN